MPIANVDFAIKHTARNFVIASMFLFAGVGIYLTGTRLLRHDGESEDALPVSWLPYSEELKNFNLSHGKKVLVFVFAELNPESAVALDNIDSVKLVGFCNGQDCEPLLLRYNDWSDPKIRAIWKDVGHTKNPMLVLYSPNEAPLACDPFSGAPLCR